MTVHDIVLAKLKELGADGLTGDDCGCPIDDLFCCEWYSKSCVPGRRTKCTDEESEWYGEVIYVPLEDEPCKPN